MGNSLSGGAATIAAATAPDLVGGVVEIGPFTRKVRYSLGGLVRIRRYRRGTLSMTGVMMLHSLRSWMRYLDVAYPEKPADYAAYAAALRAKLSEPGRMAEFLKTMKSSPAHAGAALPRISCPALIVMGTEDPDWADPRAEAEGIVAEMPAGLGRVAMIDGAGHYPHAQTPDEVAMLTTSFVRNVSSPSSPRPGRSASVMGFGLPTGLGKPARASARRSSPPTRRGPRKANLLRHSAISR